MNPTKQVQSTSSVGVTLPEPDPDNITVLTHNLPNKPILPWNHYDSPWQDAQAENADEEAQVVESESTDTVKASDHQLADAAEQPSPALMD